MGLSVMKENSASFAFVLDTLGQRIYFFFF